MILFVCYKFELYTGGVFFNCLFVSGGVGWGFGCVFLWFLFVFWGFLHVSANGKLFRLV